MTIVDDIKNAIKYFEDAIQESEKLQEELTEQRKHFIIAVTTMKLLLLKKEGTL